MLHTYMMKWVLAYFVGLLGLAQLAGCSTPTKTMNLLTPDRFGFGKVEGTLDLVGTSNGSYYGEWWGNPGGGGHGREFGNSYQDVKLDGTSEATMMWLEWDFPQWKESTDYDLYLRERVRTLNLEKALLLAERESANLIEEEIEEEQYGTGGG